MRIVESKLVDHQLKLNHAVYPNIFTFPTRAKLAQLLYRGRASIGATSDEAFKKLYPPAASHLEISLAELLSGRVGIRRILSGIFSGKPPENLDTILAAILGLPESLWINSPDLTRIAAERGAEFCRKAFDLSRHPQVEQDPKYTTHGIGDLVFNSATTAARGSAPQPSLEKGLVSSFDRKPANWHPAYFFATYAYLLGLDYRNKKLDKQQARQRIKAKMELLNAVWNKLTESPHLKKTIAALLLPFTLAPDSTELAATALIHSLGLPLNKAKALEDSSHIPPVEMGLFEIQRAIKFPTLRQWAERNVREAFKAIESPYSLTCRTPYRAAKKRIKDDPRTVFINWQEDVLSHLSTPIPTLQLSPEDNG